MDGGDKEQRNDLVYAKSEPMVTELQWNSMLWPERGASQPATVSVTLNNMNSRMEICMCVRRL